MNSFIDRGPEFRLINDAFSDLLTKDSFLRTPILDFYGVEGIGKTSILEKVVRTCEENKIRYLWADASKNISGLFYEIINQAEQNDGVLSKKNEGNLLDQSVAVTQRLLREGPLVMLLDGVDTTNETNLEPIEVMLSDLVLNNKLLVVLTSRRSILFERERDVARKLTTFPLLPFDRYSSEEYLDTIGLPVDPELREIIFDWTQGYPLAMNVMVKAITEQQLDPRSELGRRMILSSIMDRVIDQGILARVESDKQPWFKRVLSLLSVPRRFNLLILQNLIERFAVDLKLANSLSYIVLPKRISQSTDVLSWNLAKGGFSIDPPIRNIFLLEMKTERLEDYYEINKFLAEINQFNAREVSGSDRIRYQREYLYHISNSGDRLQMPHILEITVQQIIQDSEATPEYLIQFLEEFIQDTELKESLNEHINVVLSLLYKQLAQKMYKEAVQEVDEAKRVRYFHDFFDYLIHDPLVDDRPLLLKEYINRLIIEERPGILGKLYEELAQDTKFKESLGRDFAILFARLRKNISAEG